MEHGEMLIAPPCCVSPAALLPSCFSSHCTMSERDGPLCEMASAGGSPCLETGVVFFTRTQHSPLGVPAWLLLLSWKGMPRSCDVQWISRAQPGDCTLANLDIP
ncbi:hypothetical protein AOLI_G00077120 [Acnodon oligacanthus]